MYEYNIIVFSYYFCLLGLLRLGFGIILDFMISTLNSAPSPPQCRRRALVLVFQISSKITKLATGIT